MKYIYDLTHMSNFPFGQKIDQYVKLSGWCIDQVIYQLTKVSSRRLGGAQISVVKHHMFLTIKLLHHSTSLLLSLFYFSITVFILSSSFNSSKNLLAYSNDSLGFHWHSSVYCGHSRFLPD